MPADRLTAPPAPLAVTLAAVQEVLAGAGPDDAAARTGLDPADLAAAVAVYRHAGHQALAHQTRTPAWRQLHVHFTDWAKAEQTAADHIAPVLDLAEHDGQLTGWWFIRKHPCWRIRLLLPDGAQPPPAIPAALDDLTAGARIAGWSPGLYEPETAAFGGDTGMAIAHTLFHADSHAILTTPHHDLGRRETSLLLCATLMRAAGAEWYEQGDIWHRVAQERPLPPDVPPAKIHTMAADLRHLLLADTSPTGPLHQSDRTLPRTTDWVHSFRRAGRDLAAAHRDGALDRGLRHILAYHVIFHWNRLGLHTRTQSVLAHAATGAILHHDDHVPEKPAP